VRLEAGLVVLGTYLEFVSEAVEGETGLLLKGGSGAGKTGVDFDLDGSSAFSDHASSVKRAVDLFLDFAAAREEASFQEFLGVNVDSVFRGFTANDPADMGAEIGVKGGDPGGEAWVEVCNNMC